MKKFLVLLLAVLACACAKKTVSPELGEPESTGEKPWEMMHALKGDTSPYRLQLSLRFGEEGDTRRVTALMWGNNEDQLRLDIMAGVGATIAKISQDGDHFLLFTPGEEKAYFHDGPNRPLLRIGVPLPFTLSQLADILNGRFADVFGREYASSGMTGKNPVYELEGKAAGALTLNPSGLPLEWTQKGNTWKLELDYEEGSQLPSGMKLFASNGKKAILLVKEREKDIPPFQADQLQLQLPDGVPSLPLSQYKPS